MVSSRIGTGDRTYGIGSIAYGSTHAPIISLSFRRPLKLDPFSLASGSTECREPACKFAKEVLGGARPGRGKWIFCHFTNPVSCLETTLFLCLLEYILFLRSFPHACHRPRSREHVTVGTWSIPAPEHVSSLPTLGAALKLQPHHASGRPLRRGMGGKQNFRKPPCVFWERMGLLNLKPHLQAPWGARREWGCGGRSPGAVERLQRCPMKMTNH